MAHNLNIVNSRANMAYHGEKPWHSLGQKVDHVMTSKEAIEAAGLDYEVTKFPVRYNFNGATKEINDKFVTVRQDTGQGFGVVGRIYTILQNRSAFSFFDAIVGEKSAIYHTVGALGKGEKIWLLAKLPGYIRTMGDDVTEKFLLLTNSHDGSSPVEIMWTPMRVVCQNTLNIGVQQATNRIGLRHTISLGSKVEEARSLLGIANQRFQIFEELSQQLANTQIKKAKLEQFIKDTGLVPNKETKELSSNANNIIDQVSALFETGKGAELPGAKGTLWGAFNAVSEFTDHHRGNDQIKRTSSLLFGSGAQIKQKAWDNAIALIK